MCKGLETLPCDDGEACEQTDCDGDEDGNGGAYIAELDDSGATTVYNNIRWRIRINPERCVLHGDETATGTVQFLFVPTPTILSLAPTFGSALGGTWCARRPRQTEEAEEPAADAVCDRRAHLRHVVCGMRHVWAGVWET